MTIEQFIFKIQDYYGMQYRKGEQIEMIGQYLKTKHANYIKCLYSAVIKTFTGEYKMLPNIAVFEKLTDETYSILDEQKRKAQIQDLKTPAITDGEEVDYSDEMKDLFDGMDKRFKK